MKRFRQATLGNRGMLVISTYLISSVFLLYSTVLILRTTTQRLVADRFHDQVQAMELAQGALEQLRDDFYTVFNVQIYQVHYAGEALQALGWLDKFGEGKETPTFASKMTDVVSAVGPGTSAQSPRRITLPSGKADAWIASVAKQPNPDDPEQPDPSPLAPRHVTVIARATVGATTRQIQATYEVALGLSDIFRYAYFVNNYGWFDMKGSGVNILGDVRSNGNLTFSGTSEVWVNGDLYASWNPDVKDPVSGEFPQSGTIDTMANEPRESHTLDYWGGKMNGSAEWVAARPTRRLTFEGQPAIGGGPSEYLPYGYDSEWPTPADPDQRRFAGEAIQPMPYLGDLDLYKDLAETFNKGAGSTLTYLDYKAKAPRTVKEEYDESEPLVLVGTQQNPIQLNGPIVAKGDVIIKGYLTGQGTIYAGRNIHIVGDIRYLNPPVWPAMERDTQTGKVGAYLGPSYGWFSLGSVCANGTYLAPGAGSCP